MSNNAYAELLEATIRHVQQLKEQGTSFIEVSPATLQNLTRSVVAKAKPTAKAPAPAPTPARSFLPVAPVSTPAPARIQPAVLPGSAPVPGGKAQAMAALRGRVLGCTKCSNLVAARKNIVFGVGNLDAALMFIGEAPGADEDRQGEPFVGAAGQLLNKMIAAMGLKREEVYIANILKCRPDTPGQISGNRKPTPAEMATCVGFLKEQVGIVRPKVIVGLGATAIEGLLGNVGGITRARGRWHSYAGIPLMPTYHPAYLLHNQSKTEKRKVWEDLLQAMEKLGLPLSEKQRGYFL